MKQLKRIDGSVSPFDSSYRFLSDLHENVYSGFKYIDEINDFPTMFATSPKETRKYNTHLNTEAIVTSVLRYYVYSDDAETKLSDIFQDVEHIVYNMRVPNQYKSLDIVIDNFITDSGLLKPYGMAEIFLSSRFEI